MLARLPEINFIDDGEGKPVGIQMHIGRRPVAAFGNADGDLQMHQWTAAGSGRRFCLYVHHTDPDREWAYDRETSSFGRLDKGLDEATAKGWTLVDMKNDWNTIFAFEKTNPVTAIDILLEPDATMLRYAEANNARLLKVFPKGFALDEAHRPHITLIQRFVRTRTSTRSMPPPKRSSLAPTSPACSWRPSNTTTSRARVLALRALSQSRPLHCSSCNRN